ncbi:MULTISPECIES: hypothetical protein [unclassified Pseudomonas]|uniref:hypothetical protein n=1 Tax=unclassified Pseudomonas TaxID=196821 RepID=UPI00224AC1CB|nr:MULTISPECIES: hypothetical protein [unclassified Pseudomonas]MCX2816474.1 hypothetical protein [Pseudomonas sp. DCB_E]MCX9143117.1 hypothetical protein [Pseudomonas sp. DCB_Q]
MAAEAAHPYNSVLSEFKQSEINRSSMLNKYFQQTEINGRKKARAGRAGASKIAEFSPSYSDQP